MKKVFVIFSILIFVVVGCNSNQTATEKFYDRYDKIISVADRVFDIKTNTYFGASSLKLLDDIIIVTELMSHSSDKCIHLFDKNTLNYITSAGILGKGPNEVTRPGPIGIDGKNRVIWVTDHGKRVMWKFPLDSILNNDMFKPNEKIDIHFSQFLVYYDILDDSIAFGNAIRPLSNSGFEMATARLNINTSVIADFGYQHPEAVGRWVSNARLKFSVKNELYVNCHSKIDLLSICELNGDLKCNIYGPKWKDDTINQNEYYTDVDIADNFIIASYNGGPGVVLDEFKRQRGVYPSKLIVFNLAGDYINTIDVGHEFISFCIDEVNQRVIAYFSDRENPLGFFELNFKEL